MEQIDIFTNKRLDTDTVKIEFFDSDFILSVPHAGTSVPINLELEDVDLLIEIDMLSNRIFDFKRGTRISTTLAPFVVDMNRAREGSKDAPSHLRNDPLNYITIDDKPILKSKADKSLIKHYDRYHEELDKAIAAMKKERGYALLIDGHSMTSVGLRGSVDKGKKRADFVIGTVGGTSAHPKIIEAFKDELEKQAKTLNLTVDVDKPYSGGFITRKHTKDAHVLQLEVSMDTYMHEGFIEEKPMRYKPKSRLPLIRDAILKAIEKAIEATKALKD